MGIRCSRERRGQSHLPLGQQHTGLSAVLERRCPLSGYDVSGAVLSIRNLAIRSIRYGGQCLGVDTRLLCELHFIVCS